MGEELSEHEGIPNQEKRQNDGGNEGSTTALKKQPGANINGAEMKPAGVLAAGAFGSAAWRTVETPSTSDRGH